ncbi:protein PHYTOCHROME KINASE SUBSTRATE 1-like [Malania oleifera]|uniref:protein PHYTOCHROME KINASE SUBSTRATE 1-like n=1 Tax=Malania oleifera TaxID=397392 RepID=UPI0025AEC0A7|nr:protein PHYTOCHROME KINASE SUBSTRATE 1-like [Malania oleifera]XP_057950153.1 protein PHYTOCHROME KINASE SUBSTRATE 1-like [Malania oleifera]XP_057950154.1 protein PHYTOCHROME KINASE SUBSTRATE 1-like [Malania oleifera]
MATITSACNTSFSQSFESNNKSLCDASFSSFLNNREKALVPRFVESSQYLNPIISTPQEQLHLGRKKTDDGEISVFGAERYFNGRMDEENPRIGRGAVKYQSKKDERAVGVDPPKQKIVPATPSTQSESSWNSQSALVQGVLRNPSQSKTNKLHVKSFLAHLGCNCSCSDKNSVEIEKSVGDNNFNGAASFGVTHSKEISREPINNFPELFDLIQVNSTRSESWGREEMHRQRNGKLGVGLGREDCFTFPVLNSAAGNLTSDMQLQKEGEEIKRRKSLEMFRSPLLEKGNRILSFDRRRNMLTCGASKNVEEIEIPANCHETESDASSDLFEIESLSSKLNQFLVQQTADGASGCITPTTCYPPSEASIEWSVVTASAADFSAMSDSDEQRTAATIPNPSKTVPASTAPKCMSKEIHRRRAGPGNLLGCRSQKAVSIAGNATRATERASSEPRGQHKSESFRPVARFQAGTRITGFDSRHGHLLYIQ